MQTQVEWNLKIKSKRQNETKEKTENARETETVMRETAEESDLEMEIEAQFCRKKKCTE